jgi:hypothetical protein
LSIVHGRQRGDARPYRDEATDIEDVETIGGGRGAGGAGIEVRRVGVVLVATFCWKM